MIHIYALLHRITQSWANSWFEKLELEERVYYVQDSTEKILTDIIQKLSELPEGEHVISVGRATIH